MQLTNGNLFWLKNTHILHKYEYLSQNITADVLVIGAGISGAITAYFLAKQGLSVAIVDKNIIGYGSTSATTALLEYQVDIDMYKLNSIIGQNYSKKIYTLCKQAIDDIEKISECLPSQGEFERKNVLYYSKTKLSENSMLQEYQTRKKAGFPVKLINSNPLLSIKCGIETVDSSATMNPYLFTQELLNLLQKSYHVRIYENTNIVNIAYSHDKNICTTNNQFAIQAKDVIVTSGFESVQYLNSSNYKLYKTFTIVTKPIEKLKEYNIQFTGRDTKDPYHYIRFTKDHRIMYGGEDISLLARYEKEENLVSVAHSKYKKLEKSLKNLITIKDDIGIDYCFNGTFATTPDNLPIIDNLKNQTNCYCNLGYGANGILYSTIGAKLLTNLIIGKDSKDLAMFRIDR